MPTRVYCIDSVDLAVVKTNPLGLQVDVGGKVTSTGWRGLALQYFVYIMPPADGIYEADMVGEPPIISRCQCSRHSVIGGFGHRFRTISRASRSIRQPTA